MTPSFRPNRELSNPHQYGEPFSRLTSALILAALLAALALPFVAWWCA